MKGSAYIVLLILTGVFVSSCDRKEDHVHDNVGGSEFDYRISINSPTLDSQFLQDSLRLDIDFISNNNAVVHHVNVRIFDKSSGEEIYNAPDEAHVHEQSGSFTWKDDLRLNEQNGFSANKDYIIEAKAWGHSVGLEEVVQSIEISIQE